MSSLPLVSIICLCYNHESYVTEALDSVINQDYKNIEIIIVDDSSTDNSSQRIEEWLINYEATLIKIPENIGNTKAFNKGLKLANGEYIIDFATDDVLFPDAISKKVECFINSNYKNLGVVFSNVAVIDAHGNHLEYHYKINDKGEAITKPKTGDIYKDLVYTYFISPPSMMIKKMVFDKLEGYDETLFYEDLDFWFRSSRYFEYDYVDKVLVKKRMLPKSLGKNFYSSMSKEMSKSTYKVCKKAYKLNENKEEHSALKARAKYELKLALINKDWMSVLKFGSLHTKLFFLTF